MGLCFAPLRLNPYDLYDDPIRNCSITAGTELFHVQKATGRYRKAATCEYRCPCDGCCKCRPRGGGIAKDHVNMSITLPAYVNDVAKVQIYCAWAEAVLGEAPFDSPQMTH